jgi:hypothetical protein
MSTAPLRVLSVIPPMTQLNTPYPSTAYLTGFLRSRGVDAVQEDLALALVLKLCFRRRLGGAARSHRGACPHAAHPPRRAFQHQFERYLATIGPTIASAGPRRDAGAPHRGRASARRERFESLDVYIAEDGGDPLPGPSGASACRTARATSPRCTSTTGDVLRDASGPTFEFVRYAERWRRASPPSSRWRDALATAQPRRPRWRAHATAVEAHRPSVVLCRCRSRLRSTRLRIAQAIKRTTRIVTVLGGGFVNTELRELAEPRVFDYFDHVTLDAGERPLLALIEHLQGRRSRQRLVRCLRARRAAATCATSTFPSRHRLRRGRHADLGRPAAGDYLSLLDMLNPMNRLWSDGRWNKLTVAHGCYWKKCSFCDVSLDYISRYESASARRWSTASRASCRDRQTGFHFVDEAAPPKALQALRRDCSGARWRSRGGATSASRSRSPRRCASSSPTAAASRSRAGSRSRRTGCCS